MSENEPDKGLPEPTSDSTMGPTLELMSDPTRDPRPDPEPSQSEPTQRPEPGQRQEPTQRPEPDQRQEPRRQARHRAGSDGEPEAARTQVAPAGPAETTNPLPPVPAAVDERADQPGRPEATINEPTAALPLLDLLAPREPGSPAATPPGGVPGPAAGPAAPIGPVAPGYGQPYPDAQYPAAQYPDNQYPRSHYGGGLLAGQQSNQLLSGQNYTAQQYSEMLVNQPPPAHDDPFAGPATMVGRVAAPTEHRPGPHGWPLVAGIAGCVVLLGLIGWWAIGSLPTGQSSSTSSSTAAAPTTSAVMVAGGFQFTQHSARADTDCASNAYGQVADFFRDNPCEGLRRLLFTSSVRDRPVVVSVSTVTMPDERAAAALKKLADTNGTGNVADLLRAGVRVPSVPESLSNASYASSHSGRTVVIVESDYTDPSQRSDDTLEEVTRAAIQLGQGSG